MERRIKLAISGAVAASVVALGLLASVPAGATPNMYMHHNDDTFKILNKIITKTDNANAVSVTNGAEQNATSAPVTVQRNDDVKGNVSSGGATNTAGGATTVAQTNKTVAQAPSIPASPAAGKDLAAWDDVSLKNTVVTKVDNSNEAAVTNWATQNASSGTATVTCNDDVTGNVTTGNAANSVTFTTSITQTN